MQIKRKMDSVYGYFLVILERSKTYSHSGWCYSFSFHGLDCHFLQTLIFLP